MFAKFSPDGSRVAYVREHNLYVESLADGQITPLTHDGSVTTINGTFDWVYEEELDDRDGFRWSPDGKHIAYWQLDAKGVRDFLLIDNTDSLYSFVKPVQYPKAGTTNSAARIGVVSAAGGPTTWLEIPGDPRNNYLARMDWEPGTNDVLVQQLNRRQTQNTFYVANATTGGAKPLFVDRDSAWIDIYSDATGPSVDWLADNSAIRFPVRARRVAPCVPGLQDRHDAAHHTRRVRRDEGRIRRHEGGVALLLRLADQRDADVSLACEARRVRPPRTVDARRGARHARVRHRPRRALRDSHLFDVRHAAGDGPGSPAIVTRSSERLESNADAAARVAALRRGAVTFSRIDIGGGVKLDSWMMKPADFDSTKKYPVLFYVYGEPASQTVLDAYGGSTYLWHLMLTQRGYIVASVDNRGTPGPRGREWRKVVRNQIGSLRVREQSAAAKVVGRLPFVDSTRLACGAGAAAGRRRCTSCSARPTSIAPAWRSRPWPTSTTTTRSIRSATSGCRAPTRRRTATRHRSTSPTGLRGDLLVVHGSGDDNVHYQSTEQLINALVAANKPFTMMEYPNRTHGIFEGPGTRVHLFNLLTRYPERARPFGSAITRLHRSTGPRSPVHRRPPSAYRDVSMTSLYVISLPALNAVTWASIDASIWRARMYPPNGGAPR